MKALTVQQPWAWAIFRGKNIENRTQLWRYRGPLAIHAGQRWSERGDDDQRVRDVWRKAHRVPDGMFVDGPLPREDGDPTEEFHFGVIIGVVDLVDVHYDGGCCAPWGETSYVEHGGRERRQIVHLVIENPRLLKEPIPCRGALGLWTPPADILLELANQRALA